ncbi:hypothetical protein J1614_009452 [Plenodomus biglobosus]|nr:hypothetical protein J1614_009452 [Plenodomus biglobosus]
MWGHAKIGSRDSCQFQKEHVTSQAATLQQNYICTCSISARHSSRGIVGLIDAQAGFHGMSGYPANLPGVDKWGPDHWLDPPTPPLP